MLLIGDVHGKFGKYRDIIRDVPESIQLGDMGVGFMRLLGGEFVSDSNPPYDSMSKGNHRYIRGNHDNPNVCKRQKNWIPDGTFIEELNALAIGGAYSIDREFRTEGINWWSDEQLSYSEADKALDIFMERKPEIMLTHDCPVEVVAQMHSHHLYDNSFTQRMFQNMFEIHQPKLWVYGHHHMNFDMTINGTRFICLPELATMQI